MAIDKAVDSAALEANLTTIANAIREKAGTSDALAFPAGFAEAIAGISAGGGDILGHTFAAGSFTLAEDTTTEYVILSKDELFDAIKDDFPGATGLTHNVYLKQGTSAIALRCYISAIIWIDRTYASNVSNNQKELLAAHLPKHSLTSSMASVMYADSYGGATAKNYTDLSLDYNGFGIKFNESRAGYAGSKYNWLVFALDHGEVLGV